MRVALAFGAADCNPEWKGVYRDEAQQELHDQLIRANPVRLGPVTWRWYEPGYADEALREAGLRDHPHAEGLIVFLTEVPTAELLIASVNVP